MNKFCPECGKIETKSQLLVRGLCRACFLKRNGMLEMYKGLEIIICPSCQSYLYRNKWCPKISVIDEVNIKMIIKDMIKLKMEIPIIMIKNNLN